MNIYRGVKVRLISDDECSKFMGADIYELGLRGIPCTTDDN
jgi:cardiolipin hydrolase